VAAKFSWKDFSLNNSQNRLVNFLRSPRFPIFMIVFVDVLGLGITIPVLPLFAQNEMGAAAWQITSLTSVFFAAAFFAGPWLGRLSDRFGRRPVLIISQIGTLVALLVTAIAPSLLFLYLARVIDGITGGNISVAQAYLSDVTDEKNRARGMGLINAAFGLGFVFGPAFGSFAASFWGPRVPFFIAAGVSLGTILLSTFLLQESLTPERRAHDHARAQTLRRMSGWELMRVPAVKLLLVLGFTSFFSFGIFQTIYVLWADKVMLPGLPDTQVQQIVGGILTVMGLCNIVAQFWLVGPLVRRFGEKKLLVVGRFAQTFAFATMAFSPTLLASALVLPIMATAGSVAMPAQLALLTYAAPPDKRGQVIGIHQSVTSFGNILGPLLAGFLFESVHPNSPLVAAAIGMGVTALIALNVLRMPLSKPMPHPQPAPQPALTKETE
jgi:DHA1 family tetracycline resistance protein-like MFS transporter